MPRFRRYGRKRRRIRRAGVRKFRRFRRKFSRRRRNMPLKRTWRMPQNQTVPDRFFLKLRYSDYYHGTMAAGVSYGAVVWKGNGLYDPYGPAGGHQPRYRDQLVLPLYEYYKVHASKIKLHFFIYAPGAVGPTPGQVTIAPIWDTGTGGAWTPSGNPSYEAERERSKIRFWTIASTGQSSRPLRMKHFMVSKKMFGLPRIDASYATAVNADPVAPALWLWQIMWCYTNGAAFGGTEVYDVRVDVTYYVEAFCKARVEYSNTL